MLTMHNLEQRVTVILICNETIEKLYLLLTEVMISLWGAGEDGPCLMTSDGVTCNADK